MPGPKYNYLNVRDDLRIAGGTYSGQISFGDSAMNISSSTDGTLNFNADTALAFAATNIGLTGITTLTGEVTLTGDVTLGTDNDLSTTGDFTASTATFTGDLTRRTIKYISGNVGRPTGYVNPTGSATPGIMTTLPNEGIIYLSGRSGSLTPRLTTPIEGQTLSLIYIDSGAAIGCTAKISSSGYQVAGSNTKYYYLTLTYPGDAATLTGIGSTWYPTHPSGMAGNTWSVT